MKRFLTICASVAAVCVSVSAFAAMESGDPAGNGPSAAMTGGPATGGPGAGGPGGANHPCKEIADSCKSAGYTRGGAAGKGLMKDCVKPIMNGQTVAGVTASPETIAACKTKMAEREQKMGVGGGGAGGMTNVPGGQAGPGAGGPTPQ